MNAVQLVTSVVDTGGAVASVPGYVLLLGKSVTCVCSLPLSFPNTHTPGRPPHQVRLQGADTRGWYECQRRGSFG